MVFSSLIFIWLFLPYTLITYYILPSYCIKLKNIFLLSVSMLFYAWGETRYFPLLLFSIFFNYIFGLSIGTARRTKIFLFIAIFTNIGILIYFKYLEFFIHTFNSIFHSNIQAIEIPLPIGISFFTFQALSYVIDIYKGKYPPEKNLCNMALYISFFPQLIAGPIVKYADIRQQIAKRDISVQKFANGIRRFCYGLGKKVIISNILAEAVDKIVLLHPSNVTGSMAWVVAMFYTMQIYYDFSGYSDMAIGLGKMFGFDFFENFRHPYTSRSIREFWNKWHISLSEWFKEYVYIPLGGNKLGNFKTSRNLLVVFLLTGFWHGASWNFILWGLYHGLFSVLERLWLGRHLNKYPFFSYIYTFLVVVFGWILFRLENMKTVLCYFQRMLLPWKYTNAQTSILEMASPKTWIIFIFAILGCGILNPLYQSIPLNKLKGGKLELIYCMFLLLCSFILLASNTYNPFIYFRF